VSIPQDTGLDIFRSISTLRKDRAEGGMPQSQAEGSGIDETYKVKKVLAGLGSLKAILMNRPSDSPEGIRSA